MPPTFAQANTLEHTATADSYATTALVSVAPRPCALRGVRMNHHPEVIRYYAFVPITGMIHDTASGYKERRRAAAIELHPFRSAECSQHVRQLGHRRTRRTLRSAVDHQQDESSPVGTQPPAPSAGCRPPSCRDIRTQLGLPGNEDSLSSPQAHRQIPRRCGQVHRATLQLLPAEAHRAASAGARHRTQTAHRDASIAPPATSDPGRAQVPTGAWCPRRSNRHSSQRRHRRREPKRSTVGPRSSGCRGGAQLHCRIADINVYGMDSGVERSPAR